MSLARGTLTTVRGKLISALETNHESGGAASCDVLARGLAYRGGTGADGMEMFVYAVGKQRWVL